MEILTKYALGDKLFTIHDFRVIEIEVSEIIVNQEGTFYRDGSRYHNFPERFVFPSREELVKFVESEE